MNRCFIAIDLKSFYASVECMERGLNPMTTHLVVADEERTEKTICLAVTPALKSYGVPGRARLFEAVQKVEEINARRRYLAPGRKLTGSTCDDEALRKHPSLALDFIRAKPQMAKYMAYSTRIYQVYLKYVAPEDIHVYSIDEVFIDAAPYLRYMRMTPKAFASHIIRDVFATTGITATAGIGTNLYLCKVAMDILAKHAEPDECGVRIAELDEHSYRQRLWHHRPLTDFWRVGGGYARKLEAYGLFTMGDVARCSIGQPGMRCNEELLYRLFGVNAELLIDHAWGWEPCTMADIKAYRPMSSSLSTGQVLQCAYPSEKGRLIVQEMAEGLALDLLEKGLMTDQITLTVGYDIENLKDERIRSGYRGAISTDPYGRKTPAHAHGTEHLGRMTHSARLITQAATQLYDRIVAPELLVRRVTLCAARVTDEALAQRKPMCEQLNLFTDYAAEERRRQAEEALLEREMRCQKAVLSIRRRFGKNAILRGMNLLEGATTRGRNEQIGGHSA